MANTNYFNSVVRILEAPNLEWNQDRVVKLQVRAIVPERKRNKLVQLVVWGELGNRNLEIFRPNQYLLLEGFLSLVLETPFKTKQAQMTVLKVYPLS